MGKSSLVPAIDQYVRDVLDGTIPTGEYVRLAVERHVRDLSEGPKRGLIFNEKKAKRAIDFASLCRHSKGEWAGKPIELAPWQQFIHGSVFGWIREKDGYRRFRTVHEEVARKNGKGVSLDTPIPTPQGWTTMGEIKEGEILFDESGNPCKVEWVSEDRMLDCYEVEFSNGERIVCDGDHLWKTTAKVNMPGDRSGRVLRRFRMPSISYNKGGSKTGRYAFAQLYGRQVFLGREDDPSIHEKFRALAEQDLKEKPFGEDTRTRVRDTREICRTVRYGARRDTNHSIGMPSPLQLPQMILPIDPYILGVWLGDGHSNDNIITVGADDLDYMKEAVGASGYVVQSVARTNTAWKVRFRNPHESSMRQVLTRLNLHKNKHIPAQYLRASFEQRLALLQGLMDTDGHISKDGRCLSFCTVSERLKDGFCELLSTMGLKYSVKEKPKRCNRVDLPGISYNIQFYSTDELPPFRMPRKVERLKKSSEAKVNPRSRTVQIVDVRPIPTVATRCISVSSPSKMFLCGRTMIPTHNSTKSSVTGLYLLIADGESGAEIYTAATKRDQARIIHQEAVNIVKSSPDLNKLLKVVRDNIAFVERFSKFVPLSADHKTHDGLNIHGGLIDETHAHPTRDLYDVIETATGSRRQPLIWDVTTAGVVIPGSIAIEIREYAIDVLRGEVDDDSFFAYVATIDEKDDWRDPNVWIKANPNLGVSVYPDDLERKIKKARTPAAIANFKCKHLNVWTTAFSSWLSVEQWEECKRDIREEELIGKTCYAGLDLASTTDITALSLVFPDEETGTFQTLQYYWIPKDTLANRKLKDQLRNWVGQGWIEETEGATTDYQLVRRRINELTQKFQIAEIAIDRWNATQLANQLMDDGATVFGFGQGFGSMSDPTKRLEALILDEQIFHNGNPVTRWMIGNVTVKRDAADNYKPDKSKSSEKIDGVVATIMGLGRALMAIDPTSVYEKKDPVSV